MDKVVATERTQLKYNYRRFWEVIVRPDVLFTIAAIQGLSPYVFWQFGIGRAVSSAQLTYIPVILWIIGWISFIGGSLLIRRRLRPEAVFVLSPKRNRVYILIWIFIALTAIEVIFAIRLYGTLPILSYIRSDNQIDIATATRLQSNSVVGQVALLAVTGYMLSGLLLEAAIIAIEMHKKVPFVFYCGLATALFLGLLNGKRVATVRLAVFLTVGMMVFSRNAIRNGTVVIPFVKRPGVALLVLAGVFIGLFSMFGPLAVLRNQGRISQSSEAELITYQEGPILNMEQQTKLAGVGPFRFRPLVPLQGMIPTKWLGAFGGVDALLPPRVDLTAPGGFYELLQWNWGIAGIVGISAVVGMISMWLYTNSRRHIKYLLCYCHIAFSIMLAHSFNEFLIAPVVLVPCILLWVLGRWTNSSIRVRPATQSYWKKSRFSAAALRRGIL